MDLLKEKIVKEGQVYPGNILKVDCFLNHQIDCTFLREVGKEFHRLFKDEGVNKILTIEASGIAIGTVVAQEFGCPLVFAKKNKTKNIAGNVYSSSVESFTHSTTYNIIVSEKFLNPGDKVLIVDDFLAVGNALKGLIDLVKQSGQNIMGERPIVLAALNVCNEYFKYIESGNELAEQLKECAARLKEEKEKNRAFQIKINSL